ncbi:MAG: 16S rRNA (guanine(966)-N(2))-methyltransferase RsmD [Gammaproteobacteria bacterium]|nr:16S rRNA (guanine(966)-N(2))-methyltransferase RsmD [Gammaproteobacteria bacterium]
MQHSNSKPAGKYRIIGGRWRGKKIIITDAEGLRPTPDRVRETLFNWLVKPIANAACLDLFAGSGALGIEALSRGASSVVFVEKNRRVASHLGKQLDELAVDAEVVCADAMDYLQKQPRKFDIVFLDPPYQGKLLEPALRALEANGWLGNDAFIYVENPARESLPDFPPGWVLWRESKAGQVGYYLFRRQHMAD